MLPVEDAAGGGQVGQVTEGVAQPVGGAAARVGGVEGGLGVHGQAQPVPGPGDPAPGDEVVVLAEPYEHGAEHPRDRALSDLAVAPLRPGERRAAGLERPVVLLAQRHRPRQVVPLGPLAQVALGLRHEPAQVGRQGRCHALSRRVSPRSIQVPDATGRAVPSRVGAAAPARFGTSSHRAAGRVEAVSSRSATLAIWP